MVKSNFGFVQRSPLPLSMASELVAWTALAWLFFNFVQYVLATLDWPLVLDAPLMHYMAWRILEGDVPHRDFFDMNFPGSYVLHIFILKVFGASDAAFRCFDLCWLALTAWGIILYCRSQGLLTGCAAALLFMCYHVTSGHFREGERDYVLCGLLVWGLHFVANVLEGAHVRRSAALAGIVLAYGFWMKPVAAVLIGMILVQMVCRRCWLGIAVMAAAAGVVTAGFVGWYAAIGALVPFWGNLTHYLIPLYSQLGVAMPPVDAYYGVMRVMEVYFAFMLLPARDSARFRLLGLGMAYGVCHYLLQGKYWFYHLYPALLMGTLLSTYRLGDAMKSGKCGVSAYGCAVLVLVVYLFGPTPALYATGLQPEDMSFVNDLTADLTALKVQQKDGIQVMDITEGGVNVLFHLRLKNATPYFYDFMFYNHVGEGFADGMRNKFLDDLRAAAPKYIVISEVSWPDAALMYDRYNGAFPAFKDYLDHEYRLDHEKSHYRLYIRKD